MGYLFLAAAIALEVTATSFLKLTSGDRAVVWAYPIVIVGYLGSFVGLWLALERDVPLGIAYGIWAGVGVVAVAVISWIVFHETLTWQQVLGMLLVAAGVVLLEAGAKHPA